MKTTRVGHWLAATAGLWLVACGGGKPADSAGAGEPGRSPEAPVTTCGPRESYEYVAARYRCKDGSNPLGGDLKRGAEVRQGSQHAPQGNHLIDAYDVPCATGVETVYVDMYGCPEYEKMLSEGEQGTKQGDAVMAAFQDGKFENVLEHCAQIAPEAPTDEKVWCMALPPAALYALKRDKEGFAALTETCGRLHESTADNDARATQLALTFAALADLAGHGKLEVSDADRDAMVESWLAGCKVPSEQFEHVLKSMQQ